MQVSPRPDRIRNHVDAMLLHRPGRLYARDTGERRENRAQIRREHREGDRRSGAGQLPVRGPLYQAQHLRARGQVFGEGGQNHLRLHRHWLHR